MTTSNAPTRRLTKADFTIPALLLLFSMIPTLGGIVRLISVAHDTTITPDNARFLHAPTAVVIHVISATLYSVFGAFQFSSGFRRRWPGLHRRAGRVLALCGLVAGATGIWMTAFYRIPTAMQGPILYWVRMLVGTGMVASILIAVRSILRRQVARHEAFMIRAYALGQGAGMQAVVLGPWMLLTGEGTGLMRDLLMSLAWAINLGAAEWIIHRRTRKSPRTSNVEKSHAIDATVSAASR